MATPPDRLQRADGLFRVLSCWAAAMLLSVAGCTSPAPSAGSASGAASSTATATTALSTATPRAPATPTRAPTPTALATRTSVPIAAPATGRSEFYAVTDVVDGDTVKLRMNGQVETIRAIGMDTPEVVDPRTPVQCFGQEASAHAKAMLTGKEVRVESDPSQGERDQYDRLLRYLWLRDDTFFNKQMIAEGFAHEYTYDEPYKYQAEFKAAETRAREQELGLWSPATCDGDTEQPAGGPKATAVSKPAAPVVPAPAKPAAPTATTVAKPTAAANTNCSPAYPGVCIPPPPPDLDCGDVSFRRFRVVPPDPHRFDGDNDGIGCE